MDKIEDRFNKELKAAKSIIMDRDRLIQEGCYPNKFGFPITLQFEVTSKCNLACKHCYNRSGIKNNNDLMTGEGWVNLSRKIVNNGGIMHAIISGGEPLLLGKYLWQMMDILQEDNTMFDLITNGFLFNTDTLRQIQKYRFNRVQVSIDSYRSDYHDEFRGVKGSWEKAVHAAYSISLSGIPLRVASTVKPREIDHVEDFIKMAINLGASEIIIGDVMPSGRAYDNDDIFLSRDERNKLYEEVELYEKKYKKEIQVIISGMSRAHMEYARERTLEGAVIRPDGSIRLDCQMPFVIGNVLTDDLRKIWKEKWNCWQHPLVTKYIESCDPISGRSNLLENYNDKDVCI